MAVIRIDEVDDPRLEDYRKVRAPELLRRRGVFADPQFRQAFVIP